MDWGDAFSKLSFWYGLQFSEIADMPFASIEAYLSKLDVRMTEVKLMMADVVSLPNMNKSDRRSTVNRWIKIMQINGNEPVRPANKARLKMMGIGVRFVE